MDSALDPGWTSLPSTLTVGEVVACGRSNLLGPVPVPDFGARSIQGQLPPWLLVLVGFRGDASIGCTANKLRRAQELVNHAAWR